MTSHNFNFELNRQAAHMLFGLAILAILFMAPISPENAIVAAQVFSLAVLIYLLFIIDRRAKRLRSPFSDFLIDNLERKDSPPAHGAIHLCGIDHEISEREYEKTLAIQKKVLQIVTKRVNI